MLVLIRVLKKIGDSQLLDKTADHSSREAYKALIKSGFRQESPYPNIFFGNSQPLGDLRTVCPWS